MGVKLFNTHKPNGPKAITSQLTASSGKNIDLRHAKRIDVTPSIDDLLEDTSSAVFTSKKNTVQTKDSPSHQTCDTCIM
jgi:hypothetical protein